MLTVAVAVVLGLAALMPLLVRTLGRDAGYPGAAVLAGVAVWLGSAGTAVMRGDAVVTRFDWVTAAGLSVAFRMDALGLLFALIVLGIGAVVLAYAARYFGRDDPRAGRYLTLLTAFAGAMLGLVLADDVILLFVFWELTSVTSFFLIGGMGEGKPGALRAFLTTALGGLALLGAAVLLSAVAGSSSMPEVLASGVALADAGLTPVVIVLLLLAAGTKSAQLPFHFWLPGAMVAPTPVSTYLHAATMVKAGIYLLLRFTPLFAGDAGWQLPLVLGGLATAVFGAVVALRKTDLKALLAYSTVSQLGLLVGLIGIGTPLAIAAAALHTLAHALFKATLFMTVGIVDHETGTRDIRELGGLRRTLPTTALAAGLAALSMSGLPPLLGFVSKEEAFASFVELGDPVWLGGTAAVLAVLASSGTFAYSARFYFRTFEGDGGTHPHAAPIGFVAPALVTAAAGLALGVVVPRLDALVNAVSRDVTGTSAELHLALWHGIELPLFLSFAVVGLGSALVVARTRVETFQSRFRMPSGEQAFDRTYDAVLGFGTRVGRTASSDAPPAYLLPIIGVVLVVGIGLTSRIDLTALGDPAPWQAADWAVVMLLAACILGVVQARSRLAAVATLGLTGFTVAGWFVLLGAPDLALTQLLVETLTVALVVVVFRRLPTSFARGGRPRKVIAAVIALAVGLVTGLATYAFTGRREISEVGQRFLAEGEGLTGGANVVNTILVDFRALDTLGEITVIAAAAAAIVALVRFPERDAVPSPSGPTDVDGIERWDGIGMIDSPILRTANVFLAPLMIVSSLWLLVRGHDAVGGGFIGGLTAGAAVVLLYFSRGHQRIWQSRWLRALLFAGGGLLIAVAYGLIGLVVTGAFLDGAKLELPFGVEVAGSLMFDVGVFGVVVGIVVAILRHLGQGMTEEPPDPSRTVLDLGTTDTTDTTGTRSGSAAHGPGSAAQGPSETAVRP
jgi:multicomponent Na+:H+ antiporter subunit A